jgi:hypothetical protein
MSWIQWQGETWQPTAHDAQLYVHLWQPDTACPRLSWNFDLMHMEKEAVPAEPDGESQRRWINVEISELHFHERDWRRLAGREIRADPAWHEAHDYLNEYGRLSPSLVTVATRQPSGEPRRPGGQAQWHGHDFILRFGERDGFAFPCELDAWVIPEDDYYRTEPEPAAALTRFAEGPPDLRVITRAVFIGGSIAVPRVGDDPLPWARRALLEATGCDALHAPIIDWTCRFDRKHDKIERMPGWASTVRFKTRPAQE